MKLSGKLFAVLALLVAAMAMAAAPGIAATTFAVLTGTAGTQASNTTAGPVTVTPAGTFTANGAGTLNPTTSSVTIDCTDVTVSGSTEEDGTGSATVTFSHCHTSIGGTCTVTDAAITFSISSNGNYTITNNPSSNITCTGFPAIDCTVTLASGGGNINDGDEPTISLTGSVNTDGTSLCTGSLSGNATIDDTPADDTDNTATGTALGMTTTGNELDIR